MSNCKIFDIYYRTSNGQMSKLESIDKENKRQYNIEKQNYSLITEENNEIKKKG